MPHPRRAVGEDFANLTISYFHKFLNVGIGEGRPFRPTEPCIAIGVVAIHRPVEILFCEVDSERAEELTPTSELRPRLACAICRFEERRLLVRVACGRPELAVIAVVLIDCLEMAIVETVQLQHNVERPTPTGVCRAPEPQCRDAAVDNVLSPEKVIIAVALVVILISPFGSSESIPTPLSSEMDVWGSWMSLVQVH